MSTRKQCVAALKKSRDAVKEFLKKHIDNAKKIVENFQEGDSLKTLPKFTLRQTKANLLESKESFELLFSSSPRYCGKWGNLRKARWRANPRFARLESGEGFSLITEAQEFISTLTALKEEIDSEQEKDAQLHKEERERDDWLRKEELEWNDRLR